MRPIKSEFFQMGHNYVFRLSFNLSGSRTHPSDSPPSVHLYLSCTEAQESEGWSTGGLREGAVAQINRVSLQLSVRKPTRFVSNQYLSKKDLTWSTRKYAVHLSTE